MDFVWRDIAMNARARKDRLILGIHAPQPSTIGEYKATANRNLITEREVAIWRAGPLP